MKKTSLLLLFIWVLLNQTAANAYSQGITLSFKSAPLSTVFKEIEKQTNYDFIYPADELYARKVSISVTNAKVEEVMDLCLQGLPFTYSVNEKRIVVKKVEEKASISAEKIDPIELTGKVVDANGKPVEGATVTVRGTGVTTSTNADGTFVIKGVDSKASIMVTFVGFEPQIVPVRGKTDLSIKLVVTAQQMKEVVISTGYQKVAPEKFVGSYSQLDSIGFSRRAGMGILDRLDGTVPGVLFNKKSNYQQMQIRGISTLGGGSPSSSLWNPLIVVDNFPMDSRFKLSNLNPNDVENITILKDAAAASIWGSRAGNGVIVISTKKGKFNRQFQGTFSSNLTIVEKPDLFYVSRINSSEFINIEEELYSKGFYQSKLSDYFSWPVVSPIVEILEKKRLGLIDAQDAEKRINLLRNIDTRNQIDNSINREGIQQQHYLSFGGGSNMISYNLALGYNHNRPAIQGSKDDNQYTITANTAIRPIRNLDIQTSINYSQSNNKSVKVPFIAPFPYLAFKDENGTSLSVPYLIRSNYLDTISNPNLLDWRFNPLDEIRAAKNETMLRLINLNMSLSYRVNAWLNANIGFQQLGQIGNSRILNDLNTYYTRDLINRFYNPDPTISPDKRHPIPVGEILVLGNTRSNSYNLRGTINVNKNWGSHQLTALIGSDMSETKGQSESSQFYGYNDRNGTYSNLIDYANYMPLYYASFVGNLGVIPNNNSISEEPLTRIISIYSNASYTFKNRYTIYASARKDGANVFGVSNNNRWKPLWSIGGKWNISGEDFFNIKWVQTLALRSSFGFSGNVSNTSSGKLGILYGSSPALFTNLPYSFPASPNNPNLRWEKVGQLNIGVDFSILKDRVSGTFEYFNKKSTDLIASFPFDPTRGINSYPVNSGSLRGSGFEATINTRNFTGPILWNTTLGLSHAKTIVTKVFNGGYTAQDLIAFQVNPSEGRLAYAISSYRWAGLDSLTGDPVGYLNGKPSKDYQAIFRDSIDYQKYHGSSIPLYSMFLMNSISWKKITLSFNLTGKFKYFFRQPVVNIIQTGELQGTNYSSDYNKRWQKPGDEKNTTVPSILYPIPVEVNGRDLFYEGAEINVKRADHIRIQDVRLQYDWQNKRLNQTIKFAQFFIYANNLNAILWRLESSPYDPEFSGGGTDPSAAPTPKAWTVGVSFGF